MLLDLLSRYLSSVEASIAKLQAAYVERYEEEAVAPNRANLRIRVRFSSGHMLEINEAVIVESNQLTHLGYRYHFQDKDNKLIFRYDNTPHFAGLEDFPYHKHLPDNVVGAAKPSVLEAIEEAGSLAQ